MAFKDRVCCICNEHKKFLSRVNAGQKLYCMQCKAKITKEYGKDYWKPCSFGEFMESMSDSMSEKGSWRKGNMFSSWRETIRKLDEEEESSLGILKDRYAKGEITKEEFDKMKEDLE